MARRALVTGGHGFVGAHLVRTLAAEGSEVVVLDDRSRGHAREDFAELRTPVTVVEHDLTRPIPDGLLDPVDEVYHLAAIVGVDRVEAAPAAVLDINVAATRELLAWCDRHRPASVLLASTSEISDGATRFAVAGYPTPESAPFVLDDLAAPRTSYALSKATSEAMFHARSAGMRVRIARYFNVYGPRMGRAHVIPQLIDRVRQGVDPFPVYGGHQRRAFCYVSDAVAATIALVRHEATEALVVNVGNDRDEIRIADLAERLFDLMGVGPILSFQPERLRSPDRRLPDLSRLRALGLEPEPTSLAEGLRRTVEWYLEHTPAPVAAAAP